MSIKCWSYSTGFVEITKPSVEFDITAWDLFLDQFCVAVRIDLNKYDRGKVFDWTRADRVGKWYFDKTKAIKVWNAPDITFAGVFFEQEKDAAQFTKKWC